MDREVEYIIGAAGAWPPEDEEAHGAANRQWVREAWDRYKPFTTGVNYVNFHNVDDGADRTAGAYGSNLERLEQVKAAYDPTNLFRRTRNISPAPA